MIASYLVRETAVTLALGRDYMKYLHPYNVSCSSTHPTYASFIKIDGRHYTRQMRSSPECINALPSSSRDASDNSKFINRLPLLKRRKDYFVVVDAFGVLQMFPVSPSQREAWCRNYSTIPDAWWYLKFNFTKTSDDREHKIYWKIPIANPAIIIDLGTMEEPPVKHELHLRMRFFECNSPDIIGYSVALDQRGSLLTIFSHKGQQGLNQPSLPIVPGLDDITDPAKLTLAFMPLHQDEHITEIYGIFRNQPFYGITGI